MLCSENETQYYGLGVGACQPAHSAWCSSGTTGVRGGRVQATPRGGSEQLCASRWKICRFFFRVRQLLRMWTALGAALTLQEHPACRLYCSSSSQIDL